MCFFFGLNTHNEKVFSQEAKAIVRIRKQEEQQQERHINDKYTNKKSKDKNTGPRKWRTRSRQRARHERDQETRQSKKQKKGRRWMQWLIKRENERRMYVWVRCFFFLFVYLDNRFHFPSHSFSPTFFRPWICPLLHHFSTRRGRKEKRERSET